MLDGKLTTTQTARQRCGRTLYAAEIIGFATVQCFFFGRPTVLRDSSSAYADESYFLAICGVMGKAFTRSLAG